MLHLVPVHQTPNLSEQLLTAATCQWPKSHNWKIDGFFWLVSNFLHKSSIIVVWGLAGKFCHLHRMNRIRTLKLSILTEPPYLYQRGHFGVFWKVGAWHWAHYFLFKIGVITLNLNAKFIVFNAVAYFEDQSPETFLSRMVTPVLGRRGPQGWGWGWGGDECMKIAWSVNISIHSLAYNLHAATGSDEPS